MRYQHWIDAMDLAVLLTVPAAGMVLVLFALAQSRRH